MKKALLIITIIIIQNSVFAQIQDYYVTAQRDKGYDFSLKAWSNWGEWSDKNYQELDSDGYNSLENIFTIKISDTGVKIYEEKTIGRGESIHSKEYMLTFNLKPEAGNGYLLYVPIHITEKKDHFSKGDLQEYKPLEYEGYLYSSNISWYELRNGTKKEATITLWSVQRGFISDFKIELSSYHDQKIQQANEAAEKEAEKKARMNRSLNSLEIILKAFTKKN